MKKLGLSNLASRQMDGDILQPAACKTGRWHPESLVNSFSAGQGDRNLAGRRRIDSEGRLLEGSITKIVRSEEDAAEYDFGVTQMLSTKQCHILSHAFWQLEDRIFRSDKIDAFWNNRILWFSDIIDARPDAGRLMLETQGRAVAYVAKFFQLRAPLYSDLLQIVRWDVGMFMPPHADNANPDGVTHEMSYRDFGGVLYLNDDYEGGELYFTGLDVAIKPRAGMFVALSAGFHHEHAVLRVRKGTRLTMPLFMTFDAARADPALNIGYECRE